MAATATDLLHPSILAQPEAGHVWLAILNCGRALYGWPLRVANSDDGILTLVQPVLAQQLEALVVTKPCPSFFHTCSDL